MEEGEGVVKVQTCSYINTKKMKILKRFLENGEEGKGSTLKNIFINTKKKIIIFEWVLARVGTSTSH